MSVVLYQLSPIYQKSRRPRRPHAPDTQERGSELFPLKPKPVGELTESRDGVEPNLAVVHKWFFKVFRKLG